MKTRTLSLIAASGFSLIAGAVNAESITAKTSKSFTDIRPDRFISSCVDVIEGHHDKQARLFLERRGDYASESDKRTFAIQGWVWKDGERTEATHSCVAHSGSKGIVVNIDYANEQQVAESDDRVHRTES